MRGTAATLLAACAVAACASLPAPSTTEAPAFELSARVAVRYGNEAASGRAEWRHSARADDLVISNPLGQGIAEITRRGDAYTLVTSDGVRHTAADPQSLTEQALGWRLPLDGLPDWVRGRPVADVASESRYESTRLAWLKQSGWSIEYLEYGDDGLPRRLRLARDTLDIRLVIEAWR